MNKSAKRYAGQRDNRIEVVKYTTTKDAIGSYVETEESLGFYWAAMQDNSGAEDLEGKVIHLIKRTYTIPYQSEVAALAEKMVVKDRGREFNIYHTQEVGRREQLILKCTLRE